MMTIGQLAAAGGVHVETVRYYQRRGLLPEPVRPTGGVRRYGTAEVLRLQFIRRAQGVGFSLDEVAELLAVQGHAACEQTRQLTERKLADVRHRLTELQALEADLERLAADCRRAPGGAACPTLDQFAQAASGERPRARAPATAPRRRS